jgi:hypothetical protein
MRGFDEAPGLITILSFAAALVVLARAVVSAPPSTGATFLS